MITAYLYGAFHPDRSPNLPQTFMNRTHSHSSSAKASVKQLLLFWGDMLWLVLRHSGVSQQSVVLI